MADVAVKSANVDVIGYASPSAGTSNSNEVIFTDFLVIQGLCDKRLFLLVEVGKKTARYEWVTNQ